MGNVSHPLVNMEDVVAVGAGMFSVLADVHKKRDQGAWPQAAERYQRKCKVVCVRCVCEELCMSDVDLTRGNKALQQSPR